MVTRTALLAACAALAPLGAHAQSNLPAPVEAQELRQLDVWGVSGLSRADGALAPDLWNRSDPAFLASVFDRLPATYESPATRALARRVLLSGGEAPRGDAQAAARKRFEALGRMGAADELSLLAVGASGALSDPLIAQYAAQGELARGRRAEACARGRGAELGATPPPFLLRLRAYCAAAGGDRAAADLALELARSAGTADAWYTAAVAAAGGAPPARPPQARYADTLSAQLSLAARLQPGPNALNDSSVLALAAVARSDNAPQPLRAQAAALAFQRGALSAAEARTILAATPAEITSALPPLVTALRAMQAARAAPAPPLAGGAAVPDASLSVATAIAAALRGASTPAEFAAAAAFFKDDIAGLTTAPDHAATLLFIRAAIVNGDAALAQRMLMSARQAGLDQAALGPLDAALAALSGARGDQGLTALQRRIDAAGSAQARAASRDVAILAALGAPVDGAVLAHLLANPPQGGARADTGAMLALAAAVERGAQGEAALLAVAAAGPGGPSRLDAESLDRILRALRGARLEEDARRIAAEAILAGAPQ